MARKLVKFKPYIDEQATWPEQGRVIMAQYDADSVVVYQAYGRKIGRAAAGRDRLDVAGFDLERMSWIKPGFLWLMRRTEWGTGAGQEVVLAIWVQRAAFDGILERAVLSRFDAALHESQTDWQAALDSSDVVAQWDPDYPPHGPKLARRAIQIGLRGETLRRYATEWVRQIDDITETVAQQREFRREPDFLLVPAQRVYPVEDAEIVRRLGIEKSAAPASSRRR